MATILGAIMLSAVWAIVGYLYGYGVGFSDGKAYVHSRLKAPR